MTDCDHEVDPTALFEPGPHALRRWGDADGPAGEPERLRAKPRCEKCGHQVQIVYDLTEIEP